MNIFQIFLKQVEMLKGHKSCGAGVKVQEQGVNFNSSLVDVLGIR